MTQQDEAEEAIPSKKRKQDPPTNRVIQPKKPASRKQHLQDGKGWTEPLEMGKDKVHLSCMSSNPSNMGKANI